MTQQVHFWVLTQRKPKKSILKRYMYPCVHCSTIYNSQDMEALEVPINKQLGKEVTVHIYKGILLSHKKMKSYHLQ